MSIVNKVLIVGGGIAGLTSALALKKKGIEVKVIEKNPEWTVYGVGIIQPSNLLRALKSIGLGEKCLEAGFGFKGWEIYDSLGNKHAEIAGVNVAGPGYPPLNGITRPKLHKMLTESVLEQGISVLLGVTLQAWEDKESGVLAQLSNGTTEEFDLILGADGAYSKTRSQLFGDDIKPMFTGQGVWRYNLSKPADMDWGSIHYGKKSKAGLVPMTNELMYLFLVTEEPGNPVMDAEKLDVMLLDRLKEYGGIIEKLKNQITDPANVVYRPMEVISIDKPWHKGRVILIGDAAHSGTPHLAEGAAMAIEDSVVLAEMLSTSKDSVDATLIKFVDRRIIRTELVYQTGLSLGQLELDEWHGKLVDPTKHGQLMGQAYQKLMQEI